MRFGKWAFSASLIPTLAAILALTATVSLGRWQLARAEEKSQLQRQYETVRLLPPVVLTDQARAAEQLRFRAVLASGTFDPGGQIFLDNKVHNGQAGYLVITPMKLAGSSRYVLVNRGWIARGAQYPQPPDSPPPAQPVTVEAYGALPVQRFLELSTATTQGKVWQNLTFERYRQETGLDVLPVLLVQTAGNTGGLAFVDERVDFGVARHQGYAFQWFALAAALVAAYLFVTIRHEKP